jgi:hypothetical protein
MAFSVKLLRVSYGLSLLVVSPFSDSINPLLLQNILCLGFPCGNSVPRRIGFNENLHIHKTHSAHNTLDF